MEDRKKIIVICGPTASGKTGLSLKLAKIYNGEIISADSMQVYKKLDVGTAKATTAQQAEIKHHLIDFLFPDEKYNAQVFITLAKENIDGICSISKLPFIVGGTGLYIESLVNGITFTDQKDTTEIKDNLKKMLAEKGKEYMYSMLQEIDPEYAAGVHPNNTVRVMRGIEIFKATGKTMSQQLVLSRPNQKPYDTLIIALGYKDRQKLYDNINNRVDTMIEQGLLGEARYVYDNKDSFINSAAAIGYKEFFLFFEGEQSLEQSTQKLKQISRNYAKRQLTWFNGMPEVNWLYVDSQEDYTKQAIELVGDFLNGKYGS